jgi:hypothetical protein|tara:strand:- start:94 stop:507 length:414 start_codon:yes stop_codon:yes gene_type:complete
MTCSNAGSTTRSLTLTPRANAATAFAPLDASGPQELAAQVEHSERQAINICFIVATASGEPINRDRCLLLLRWDADGRGTPPSHETADVILAPGQTWSAARAELHAPNARLLGLLLDYNSGAPADSYRVTVGERVSR